MEIVMSTHVSLMIWNRILLLANQFNSWLFQASVSFPKAPRFKKIGEMLLFDKYFPNGLKPPTSKDLCLR